MSEISAPYQTTSFWRVVWKLLFMRLLILISSFRRARLRRKISMLILGALILGLIGGLFVVSLAILNFLRAPELVKVIGDQRAMVENMPALIVGGAFIGILLTSFGVLLQALYLSGDMDFLLSKPVPIRAVFTAKLLQAILPNFGLICVFSLPILYGLGASYGYNILYYPLVLIVMSALALAAAGISSLLVMGAVRIFPARRVAEVLGFVGAVMTLLCSQSGQLARMNTFSNDQATQALGTLTRFNQPWSPLTWAGRGLVFLGEGKWLPGLGLLALILLLSGVIFAVALVTCERLYYTGWASLENKGRKKKARSQPRLKAERTWLATLTEQSIPSAVRAILVKDFLVMRRDLRNMSQLVTPLIIGIIYAVMLLRGGNEPPAGRGEAPAWFMEALRNLSVYFNVGLAMFVGWMLLARLAGMGFSQEGRSYWLLKAAPVSVTKLISAKFLVAYLPVIALTWTFVVVTWLLRHASLEILFFSLAVVALCLAGNTGINLTFGIAGANMNWEDPRQMQRGTSSCFGSLASMIYLPISLGLSFGPGLLAAALGLPAIAGQALGLALGGGFGLACACAPLALIRKRVARMGEG